MEEFISSKFIRSYIEMKKRLRRYTNQIMQESDNDLSVFFNFQDRIIEQIYHQRPELVEVFRQAFGELSMEYPFFAN